MSTNLILDNFLGKNTKTSEKDLGNGTKQVCDLTNGECYVVREKDGLIERVDNTMKTNKKNDLLLQLMAAWSIKLFPGSKED